MELSLVYAGGMYHAAFAVFHVLFWKLFSWKEDLRRTSPANRAILQIENTCLIALFSLVAILCFVYPFELLHLALGRAILFGISVFWLIRFLLQFIFLRVNRVAVHILSLFFFLGAVLFGVLSLGVIQ